MNFLDIFTGGLFTTTSLTAAVNHMPFIPGRLGEMGLFDEVGVNNTSIVVEERHGVLALISNTPRSAPGQQNTPSKRKGRSLLIPHLQTEDTIGADEIQGVRAFGSTDQLQGPQVVIQDRFSQMVINLDATIEYHRLGAIKGIVYDADGTTVIHNLFTEFNIAQEAVVNFALGTATTNIKAKCNQIVRTIATSLGAAQFNHVHCLCGSGFFDAITTHAKMEKAFERQDNGQFLRDGQVYSTFTYGGIVFEEYRGAVNGSDMIGVTDAHFFPVGVPGLFKTNFAPADFMETANTIGLPRYAKVAPDVRYQQFVELLLQSNPINYCTKPKVLMQGLQQ